MNICATCGELVEDDVCPNGSTHNVYTLEEASDIINDYQRVLGQLEDQPDYNDF